LWPQVIIDDKGELVQSLSEILPLRDSYRAKEWLRLFGEVAWEAHKRNFTGGYDHVLPALKQIAEQVQRTFKEPSDLQGWDGFKEVGGS
jgi:hypothetical protein